ERGRGSTFSFTIPIAEESTEEAVATFETNDYFLEREYIESQSSPRNPSDYRKINSGRILLVDDDPINLKILREMLEATYVVQTATNSQEALRMIKEQDWDLVISDVMMPNMSGYELTRKIRTLFS